MRTLLLVAVGSLAAAVGEAFLSKGMKEMGDVRELAGSELWKMGRMFANPRVLLGIVFLAGFFFLYAGVLSWADLSYAMPATALGYVFGTAIAALFLGERVSARRWTALAVIVLGVLLLWEDERWRAAAPRPNSVSNHSGEGSGGGH
jgi:drug/metabolite transporter (DMT)-like permease